MANIKSNIKSSKQDKKAKSRNKSYKNEVKTLIKKANTSKKAEDIAMATKFIDKAVTHGTFHRNKAARLKSKVQSVK